MEGIIQLKVNNPRTFIIIIKSKEEWDKAAAKLKKSGRKFGPADVKYTKKRNFLIQYYSAEPQKVFHVEDTVKDWPMITCEDFLTKDVSYDYDDETIGDTLFKLTAKDKKKVLDEHIKWRETQRG
jgi:hypothetical protein